MGVETGVFEPPYQRNLIPDGQRVRYIMLVQLEEALRASWGPDTSAETYKWRPDNRAFGQCAVTALVVQEIFGGRLVKDPGHNHYWNILEDGTEIDLSREQFSVGVTLNATEERTRDYMFTNERSVRAGTPKRYKKLWERVRNILKR